MIRKCAHTNLSEKLSCSQVFLLLLSMKHELITQKTARYFTQGNKSTASTLLIALPGYGQLAEYFINKFHSLDESFYVVVPEGLHRFYLKGASGRVGASWMTKVDREVDIQDNMVYLDNLMNEFKNESFKHTILLGFSQGGATAARYSYMHNHNIDHLIIWASVFPPDISIEQEINSTKAIGKYFALGNEDEFFTPDQQNEVIDFMANKDYACFHFNGKHDIHEETLKIILNSITFGTVSDIRTSK